MVFFRNSALILAVMLMFPGIVFAIEKAAPGPDVKALVAGVLNTYGGAETIERINGVYAKGRIKALMYGDEGSYMRYFERKRKLRVETSYSRSMEIRILNGKRGWHSMNSDPLPEVRDYRYLAMVYQYKQLDLPYGLMKKTYLIKSAATETLDSRVVYVLELFDGEGPPLKVYIDSGKFLIVKVTGILRVGDVTTTLSVDFSDFRTIHGMPFPYKISNYANGHHVSDTVIEKYSVNTPMAVSLFKP